MQGAHNDVAARFQAAEAKVQRGLAIASQTLAAELSLKYEQLQSQLVRFANTHCAACAVNVWPCKQKCHLLGANHQFRMRLTSFSQRK